MSAPYRLEELNELIGHYRDLSEHDKSLSYSKEAIDLMDEMGIYGTIPYATTLLNIANALRAANRLEEAMKAYQMVFPIYKKELDPNDELFASFYNNLSLLYQEMQQFDHAIAALEKAFTYYTDLEMEGLLLEEHGEILGFTMASPMSADTFDVHYEKARGDIDGAYTTINSEFANYIRSKY